MKDNLNIPKGLLDALASHKLEIEPLEFACANITAEGELRTSYLLLDEKRLIFAVSAFSDEMAFSGAQRKTRTVRPEDIGETYVYSLSDLAKPQVCNQIVGGLLVVDIRGVETWICRFTSDKMREMRHFADTLSQMLHSDVEKKGENREGESDDKQSSRGPGGPRRGGHGGEVKYCPKCGMPYPEQERAICPRCMEKRTVFARILSYFKEYRWRVAVMLLCIVLSGIFSAIWPYLSGTILYDKILSRDATFAEALGAGNHFLLLLGLLTLVLVVVKVLQQVTGVIHGRMTAYMVPGVVCKLKNSVFASLQRLSIGFFTRRQTGSLMQRVNNDANEVMHFFIDGLPYLLFNVLTILVIAFIMFSMNWQLAVAALCMLPPLMLISYHLLPRIWHAHGRRARVTRSMYSVLNDSFTGARVVRAFGKEDNENQRFRKNNDRVRNAELSVVRYRNGFDMAYAVARDIPTVIIWSIGALLILYRPDQFSYGQLITFVGYLGMLQGPMDFFSHVFQWWAESMNSAQRIFEIIDSQPEIVESDHPLQMKLKGNIELKHVNFSYEPNKPVLQDVSFSVKAGEMLGIVGRSGAGKSTLVNLMSRLYDADSGEILMDGTDIRKIAFSSLRGAVAMVSQETYIFMGTVAENIAYARPEATRDEIVEAAIAASAHSFICRLPDGYDTIIGAGGRNLSGGERQRLSIARAILANPQILVLDEATASVDTETERAIQASLDQLVKGRTTISIAHRLSTLRGADRLIVLDNGRVAESGTHAELVAQKGIYYKLLQLQSKALAMRGVGD